MRIYTRTGDGGQTGMLGGLRVSKADPAIAVCGELDETSAALGLALAFGPDPAVREILEPVQRDLLVIGSHVAACRGSARPVPGLEPDRVRELEAAIDRFDGDLPALDSFILPGGTPCGAALHWARAVCRRAERALVVLLESGCDDVRLSGDLVWLNRLADLLFVMARWVNFRAGAEEPRWRPDKGG